LVEFINDIFDFGPYFRKLWELLGKHDATYKTQKHIKHFYKCKHTFILVHGLVLRHIKARISILKMTYFTQPPNPPDYDSDTYLIGYALLGAVVFAFLFKAVFSRY
jgi:hypothetical protein